MSSLFIFGLLIALITLAQAWAKKMLEQMKVNNAVKKANDTIWKVVSQLAQETADNLKAAAEDGKLTYQEQKELRDTARDRAIQLMGTETMNLLMSYTTDIYAWIDATIDTMARAAKRPTNTPPI